MIKNQTKLYYEYEQSFASHPKAKLWSNKNECKPIDISKCSNKKFIFDCDCGHEIMKSPKDICNGSWCSYCGKGLRKMCYDEKCVYCFNTSFASVQTTLIWSDKNEQKSRNVFKSSNGKYIFNCNTCTHEFEISLSSITNGGGCPFCAIPSNRLCNNSDCTFCFDRSFASVPKANCWSDKNICKPRDVLKFSSIKYIFNCDICKHIFEAALNNVTKNFWCGFCSHAKMCNSDDCQFCYDNSFASNPRALFWSEKNDVKPRMCFKRSTTKNYIFDCPDCDKEYVATLDNVTCGKWCTCTTKKSETKLFAYLTTDCDFNVEKQKKFNWCKNVRHLPFDFCIEEYKLLLELDGRQHFMQVLNWPTPEQTQKIDTYKMECANKNGYSVIRISQMDVWNNKNDWQENLKKAIKKYDKVTNVYIGKCYENYPVLYA